jgi:molecular chaperone HscC
MIGIDLGTTNSLAAIFRNGKTELVPNALGHVLTPSAVSIDETGEVLIGLAARERLGTHPGSTVTSFKRWMGTDHVVDLGSRRFRAEELSSFVLGSLKSDAEAYLGEPVSEAVITVPAYFNDAQRQATRVAGELAGLKVARLLNEPTAAGLAYGLAERPEHTVFLIVDLGGGTFDVSVLEYFDGVVEVRASAGDTRLGGEDFVSVLSAHLLASVSDQASKPRKAMRRSESIWRTAEQLKRDLSDAETAEAVVAKAEGDGAPARITVTRRAFEEMSAELLQRIRRPIERALSDARIDAAQLSEVVLVGGATRMPMVRQLVTRLFQRLPLRLINPEETVARGAAIQAGLLARDAALDEVVLTDVMPYSLGVVASQRIGDRDIADCFVPIIERNTPVPVSREQEFSTVQENQTLVRVDVRQGESPIGSENLKVAEIEVAVPPRPPGAVAIDIRFSYDTNGLLEIDVRERESQQRTNRVVKVSSGVMTEAEVQKALERLAVLKIHPRDQAENRFVVERAKRLYEDQLGDVRTAVGRGLAEFQAAMASQDPAVIRDCRHKFEALLDRLDRGFVL